MSRPSPPSASLAEPAAKSSTRHPHEWRRQRRDHHPHRPGRRRQAVGRPACVLVTPRAPGRLTAQVVGAPAGRPRPPGRSLPGSTALGSDCGAGWPRRRADTPAVGLTPVINPLVGALSDLSNTLTGLIAVLPVPAAPGLPVIATAGGRAGRDHRFGVCACAGFGARAASSVVPRVCRLSPAHCAATGDRTGQQRRRALVSAPRPGRHGTPEPAHGAAARTRRRTASQPACFDRAGRGDGAGPHVANGQPDPGVDHHADMRSTPSVALPTPTVGTKINLGGVSVGVQMRGADARPASAPPDPWSGSPVSYDARRGSPPRNSTSIGGRSRTADRRQPQREPRGALRAAPASAGGLRR